MKHPLEAALANAWPSDQLAILAVSGGADSIAMLHAARATVSDPASRLAVAHFNHQLRGAESDEDQRFVAETCAALGIACEIGTAPVRESPDASRDGLEGAARKARYQFLERVADRLNAAHVAVAHTADDQAETVLHRVLRGTGIAGLAGIPARRPLGNAVLIRPLLKCRGEQTIGYLREIAQPWREDSSNRDSRFARNRIRRDLLPRLAEEYNANIAQVLARVGPLAGETQAVIDEVAQRLEKDAVVEEKDAVAEDGVAEDGVVLDCDVLAGNSAFLTREVLVRVWRNRDWPRQGMGFVQWEQLAEMTIKDFGPGQRDFPGRVVARRRGGRLLISRRTEETK
ncbi:MAG: tRNA lysidine(34) synthetase TilS [Planctomycetales bacterium]